MSDTESPGSGLVWPAKGIVGSAKFGKKQKRFNGGIPRTTVSWRSINGPLCVINCPIIYSPLSSHHLKALISCPGGGKSRLLNKWANGRKEETWSQFEQSLSHNATEWESVGVEIGGWSLGELHKKVVQCKARSCHHLHMYLIWFDISRVYCWKLRKMSCLVIPKQVRQPQPSLSLGIN